MNRNLSGITLLGLGPGDPDLLTRQAWRLIESLPEIYLRTKQHPVVAGFPASMQVHSFDELYDQLDTFEQVYEGIIERILELGRSQQGVVYAVPGSPFVAEATTTEIAHRAQMEGIPVRVIEGLSFLEPTFTALGIDPFPKAALVDALELAQLFMPPFPPDVPALIAQLHDRAVASEVKLTLMEVYPDDYPVQLVHGAGTTEVTVESIPLYEIDRSQKIGLLTTLYLPALDLAAAFEAFQNIIAHLRAPNGCPWDREQTHQTLRPHLIEEAYEVLSALDAGDAPALCEELGDLLLQIVLHAQIAGEYGEFNMADILRGIYTKIVRRHPHVFGDVKAANAEAVLQNWEKLKAAEREEKGDGEKGLLDSVANALPALIQAETYQKRAARVGFDWPDIQGVMDKVDEEIAELRSAEGESARIAEMGDLLFAVVNLARWYDVDAESALRAANQRFHSRFSFIERTAREEGKNLADMTLDEMDVLWDQAKKSGG